MGRAHIDKCELFAFGLGYGVYLVGFCALAISNTGSNPAITRAIHVDIRFVLWMMQYVDGAQNLLDEMTIVRD